MNQITYVLCGFVYIHFFNSKEKTNSQEIALNKKNFSLTVYIAIRKFDDSKEFFLNQDTFF